MQEADGADAASSATSRALRDFLRSCRSDWGPRDLRAALRKLSGIGVVSVAELLVRVRRDTLNEDLDASGQRRFAPETLELIRLNGGLIRSGGDVGGGGSAFSPKDPGSDSDDGPGFYPLDMLDAALQEDAEASARARRECNSLQRDICRGLDLLREMAAESRRQNEDFAAAERVSAKVSAALRQRDDTRRRAAAAPSGAATGGGRAPPSSGGPASQPRAAAAPGASGMPGRAARGRTSAPTSTSNSARRPPSEPAAAPGACPRAAQSGFAFGSKGGSFGADARGFGERAGSPKPPPEPEAPLAAPLAKEAAVRDSLRAQLLAACGRSEGEKRAHVKRLLVQWHPDRNPDCVELSTAAFQYIQQEKVSLLGLT
eukprot:TRINITY_DN21387_c0_g1_i1.p1 TRINITY_DN21387_c0_g1~~TRINITY_DN21387_c0_g1_i1.p1  ORF type:complete len:427 (+),score=103.42 TRINITY_DN21387_c0_g1_i1:164-1282(+)